MSLFCVCVLVSQGPGDTSLCSWLVLGVDTFVFPSAPACFAALTQEQLSGLALLQDLETALCFLQKSRVSFSCLGTAPVLLALLPLHTSASLHIHPCPSLCPVPSSELPVVCRLLCHPPGMPGATWLSLETPGMCQ